MDKKKIINTNRSTDITGFANDCRCIEIKNVLGIIPNLHITELAKEYIYLTAARIIARKRNYMYRTEELLE